MRNLLFLLSFFGCLPARAQLSVGNGSLCVSGGTAFLINGVTFVPSGRMTLNNNAMRQSATPVQVSSSVFSIAKVVTLNSPLVFTGTLRLSYDDADLNGNPEEGLKLDYRSSGSWISSAAGTVNTTDNYVEETVSAKSFEGLTASAYFAALPVSLLSFTAIGQTNGSILLQWHTAEELNNSHFTIERSGDASRFIPIGTVPAATGGQGHYSFTDAVPLGGRNYYRLRQHDLNGAEQVYGVRLVNLGNAGLLATVSPNPAAASGFMVNLGRSVQEPLPFSISNAAGQIVLTGRILTQRQWVVTSSLPAGSYLLQLGNGQTVRFQKQ